MGKTSKDKYDIYYKGEKYKYHEPVQTPIVPFYEEALSLSRSRDFHMADVNVIIENENMNKISLFEKTVLQQSQTKMNVEAKTAQQDQDENEAPIDMLQNLYV
ncbi:hypothetical protein EAI_14333 [Harpegnathos saltator]|uniref:Uncharacterized protein n=1 Tax=Harpegnathos saltator TaxID=610380 RepID=E2BRL3_HARSA|nr:hypothetical protein EAI_14333 [Harpegnathos saltator]